MTLDEAIKVLRQHNEKGESVLRITRGQALEKDLLAQVLDSCEQLVSEKAEYKRLLKVAVEDIESTDNCRLCKYHHNPDHICQTVDDCFAWRYADEAEKLLNDEK